MVSSHSLFDKVVEYIPRMWELTHTTKCGGNYVGPYKLQGKATVHD